MSEGYFTSPNLDQISNENPHGRAFYYFNYAAAVSEVEIDSLTGEFTILRSDIVYDAGHSLNPAIDTGQVSVCMCSFIAQYYTPIKWEIKYQCNCQARQSKGRPI